MENERQSKCNTTIKEKRKIGGENEYNKITTKK